MIPHVYFSAFHNELCAQLFLLSLEFGKVKVASFSKAGKEDVLVVAGLGLGRDMAGRTV